MDSSDSGITSVYLFFVWNIWSCRCHSGSYCPNLGNYRSVQYQYIPENADS